MPKRRRLSGPEVIKILAEFGFMPNRIRGSHHRVTRIIDGQEQHITVPVHGNRPLAIGTLKKIYRELCLYASVEEVYPLFYG